MMAPTKRTDSIHEDGVNGARIFGGNSTARSRLSEPLVYSGSLDSFKYQDLTPVIGREFEGLQVTDLLSQGDTLIRDLAVTGTMFWLDTNLTAADSNPQSHNAVLFSCETRTSHRTKCAI